jgi:hypothetical protein
MAKKRSSAIVRVKPVVIRPPRPIVRTKTRIVHKKAKKHHRGHKRSALALGGLVTQSQVTAAIGGAALGFIQKQFTTLPSIPMLGKNGTIALAATLLSKHFPLAKDIATAAIVVSAYQLGSDGKVSGEEVEGYVAGGF